MRFCWSVLSQEKSVQAWADHSSGCGPVPKDKLTPGCRPAAPGSLTCARLSTATARAQPCACGCASPTQ